ncbi:MAG: DUF2807 domain-containing protein [Muribaculaceae bacterium]|nr:DUF2807 domain-containing protein [Muribaculaceae bacterium]
MKFILTPIIALICGVAAYGQNLTKYELKVGEFNELKVVDGINVDYKCNNDSAGLAVFTSLPEKASAFIFNNKKGKLSMQISTESVGMKDMPTVTVYSKYLTKVENSGDSTVRVLSVAKGPKFAATLMGNGRLAIRDIEMVEVNGKIATGNGTLVLDGSCEKANYTFMGTGVIQADGMKAEQVSVKASGTGSIGVWAVSKLSIMGAGSTKVYYKGNPEIKNRSVGIKATQM